jgi:hypothetical protein
VKVPTTEEIEEIVTEEIRTTVIEKIEINTEIEPKYNLDDIAASWHTSPSDKQILTQKYLPEDSPGRHHNKIFKEMNKMCENFDKDDPTWRTRKIVNKPMKIKIHKIVEEPVETVKLVTKVIKKKKTKTKIESGISIVEPVITLIPKRVDVEGFKKIVCPEPGKFHTEEKRIEFMPYNR